MASEGDEHHHHHHHQHQHHHNRWDVFLSFAGEDTRNRFVDHLYSALKKSRILTFKDDEKLERGEPISHTLLEAIEESMIAVVVFSKKYASSRWCLDELVKIMDCLRRCSSSNSSSMRLGPKTVVVIPIFYHVDPSDVRNPIKNGYFGGNIISGQHNPAQVEIWRKALEEAGNLAGHVLNDTINRREAKVINTLVKEICNKLPDTILSEDEHLVGMKSHIEEVISLLNAESDAVRFVGIWGSGGIGKTALAKAIFCRMRNQFEVACFLDGEERHGLRNLKKQLVNNLKINNVCEGNNIMRSLRSTSVLLVLDDVDCVDSVDMDQLEVFFQKLRLFGPGSKILITTRNKRSLVREVDEKNIYEAKLLKNGEAIRLFSRMAFKHIHPTREFEHLSYEVIKYANGLPLALKVLGRALYGRELDFWKDTLGKLRKEGPDSAIHKKLKISFDGLDRTEQETFLDIACIFEGMEKEHVTRILRSFVFFPHHSIRILIDKSLIYVSGGNTLCMHNLIREMGRRIDREKPRRLWDTNDFERLLKCRTAAENIECILLHPLDLEGKRMEITTKALRKMPKLRLLVVRNVRSRQAPSYLSSELRWLIWDKFPSESLPPKAYNLVGLELHRSNIKRLWKKKEMMDKLTYIDLSFSPLIESTPNFTSTPNLEVLILRECNNLKVVHQSLGALERLVRLDLSRTGIRELPSSIEHLHNLRSLHLFGCKNFASLPGTVGKLKCLYLLVLSWCSKLEKLPEELGNLECLDVLHLNGTGIKEVPSSIEHLSGLGELVLSNCKNLRSLPSAICKLKCLYELVLSGCSKLEKLPEELGSLECLSELLLDGTAITQPPLSIRFLNNLTKLRFSRSSQSRTSILQFLPTRKRKRQLEFSRSSQSRTSILQSLPTRKRKRQEDDSTWSLVLPFVSDLRSLRWLRLVSCNMLDVANPSDLVSCSKWSLVLPFVSDLRSLRWLRLVSCNMLDVANPSDLVSCSLEHLVLSGNCFVQLPSLNQLSKLVYLDLDGCKMLEALPELPSSIIILSADDCQSLRLSVDRITNCRNLYEVSFRNCLQLLKEYNGESKNEAISTLCQHMIEGRQLFGLSILLPGGDIPKWFSKQTTGHSISLELPSNWTTKRFGFCVVIDPGYEAPFKYFARREKVRAGVRCAGYKAPFKYFARREKVRAGVRVHITVRTRSNRQVVVPCHTKKPFYLRREKNISMEHVFLEFSSFADLWRRHRIDANDWCGMEFSIELEDSIKNSSTNTARITKWGMCLVPNIKQFGVL